MPLRHRLHVAAGHAAVGVQPFVDHHQVAGLVVLLTVVQRQPAADVHQRVFLAAHGAAVGVGAELAQDLGDLFAGIARLALLDEVRVLDRARGVEHDRDAVPVAERAQIARVLHRDRLAAGHVHRRGQAEVGHMRCADLGDQRFELAQIHVALERMEALRIVRLIDDHIHEGAAGQLLMQPGGGEVHVAGHEIALLDVDLREDVLGAAALMGGHHVLVAVILLDGGFEVVEVAAAGIGFVAHHHAGPLIVAHRRRAGIGQQVDVDIVRAQQEGVVAGLGHALLAILARRPARRSRPS